MLGVATDGETVRHFLSDMTDGFINDYLKDNPPTPPLARPPAEKKPEAAEPKATGTP